PSRLANLTVGYRHRRARAALTLNEAGRQYLDNSEDNRKNPALQSAPGYQKKLIEEHATWNGLLSFDLGGTGGFGPLGARRLSLELRGMNLTDLRYETAGYVYAEVPYFYPAATRPVFLSLNGDFCARRARRSELSTVPDQLDRAYGRPAALLGAGVIQVLSSPAPYVLMLGILIQMIFGWALIPAVLVGTFFCTAYSFRGGMRSVVNVDNVQFVLMYLGFLV